MRCREVYSVSLRAVDPRGGGNACVAAALSARRGFAPASADYVARQGRALGRDGRVEVRAPDEDLRFRIGGRARRMVCGDLRVPA